MEGAEGIRQVRSAVDFVGLAELKGRAERNERGALRETAQQFEAMFMQMMMKTMREATLRSDLFDTPAIHSYEAMHDRELAVHLARHGGFGLAEMLVTQLARQDSPPVAQEALQLRQDTLMESSRRPLRESARAYALDAKADELQLRPLGASGRTLLKPHAETIEPADTKP